MWLSHLVSHLFTDKVIHRKWRKLLHISVTAYRRGFTEKKRWKVAVLWRHRHTLNLGGFGPMGRLKMITWPVTSQRFGHSLLLLMFSYFSIKNIFLRNMICLVIYGVDICVISLIVLNKMIMIFFDFRGNFPWFPSMISTKLSLWSVWLSNS